MFKKLLERFQTTGGSANANNGKGGHFAFRTREMLIKGRA
jgi:hypothetical protein